VSSFGRRRGGNYGIFRTTSNPTPAVAAWSCASCRARHPIVRATGPLLEWLAGATVPLITDVDTRQVTRYIRSRGAMRGVLRWASSRQPRSRKALAASPSDERSRFSERTTIPNAYTEGPADATHHVVAFDFGMKRNILRLLCGTDVA